MVNVAAVKVVKTQRHQRNESSSIAMSAYDAIFSTSVPISCLLAALTVLSLLLERDAVTARSILFSFQFLISPLFFGAYLLSTHRVSETVLIALSLETLYLAVYRILFAHLFRHVTAISDEELRRMRTYLLYGTWLVVIIGASLYLQGGVGISRLVPEMMFPGARD